MGAFGGFGAYVQNIFQDCPGKLRLAALIVSMAASDLLLGSLHFLGHQANPAWLANGIMLGVLLSCPLRQLGAYGLAGAMGFALWGFCVSLAPPLFLAAAAVKPLSITVAAVIVRRHLGRSTDLTRPGVMWQFIMVAVLAAPVLPSLTSTFIRSLLDPAEIATILASTILANALGTAIIAPFVVSLYRHELFEAFSPERRVKAALALSGLIFGTGLVFSLTHYSFLFLIMPLLLVTVAQLTMLGASLGLTVILLISTVLTQQGLGPFLILPYSDEVRSILLQVFLLTGCLMAYHVAAIISTKRTLELGLIVRETRARFAEAKLRESERFHRHLSENASDIISRFSLDGRRLYVSPSAIDI
jgi:integral membrane sensor domain MASE1